MCIFIFDYKNKLVPKQTVLLSNLGIDRIIDENTNQALWYTVLTEPQQQEIRLLATIGSILAYTSDINQCNKVRKRNRSLG